MDSPAQGWNQPSIGDGTIIQVKSVNWHFTSKCNYHCTFCCTQKNQGELTSLQTAADVFHHLRRLGIQKINFVGGEPFCSPLIFDLVKLAKEYGLTTSITTNGSLVTTEVIDRLSPYLDWMGLSVDSASNDVEKALGRGYGRHVSHAVHLSHLIRNAGIRLKVNTTVTQMTASEDMHQLIATFSPDRWKVFQFLHVKGQNDHAVENLSISDRAFEAFKERHMDIRLHNGFAPVFESADTMIDSYLMLAPSGNIYQNTHVAAPEVPLASVQPQNLPRILNIEKYSARGGIYEY
ncbi:MAG: radical SAM protein [Methanomicrobiales archaeon]|nr:radical SAM protein [Methanomicrobiales archaeon]